VTQRAQQTVKLWLLACAWLALARGAASYGAPLLPSAVARELTLHSFLSLVLVVATAAGVSLAYVLLERPRDELGLAAPSPWPVLGAALAGPLVLVLSSFVALEIALPRLLAELAAGGKSAVEAQQGEFGRALKTSHPATTLVWAVLLTPVAEELLFRGAFWSAVTRLTRREEAETASLPPELIAEGFVARALGSSWRWLRAGGIATLATTGLFAALHADQPGAIGLIRVVQSVGLGLALGVARHHGRSVLAPMALLAVYNFLVIAKTRGWLTSRGWPPPLPIPSVQWHLALVTSALLGAMLAIGLVRRRRGG
jgi:membrane protease YdiL (CAAX protease family)